MIEDEVENLIHLIEQKSQLRQNVNDRAGFRTRLEELQAHFNELNKRAELVKAFTDRGFARPDVSNRASTLLTQVNAMLERILDAPDSIITFNNVAFKSASRNLNAALDEYISESWWQYAGRTRQINDQVLDGLASIAIFKEVVQRVRTLAIQIKNCRNTLPSSHADFDRFDRLVRDAGEAWEELGSTELPDEVEAFLRSAGSREGASLDLLTGEVVEWLTQKEIKSSFRIYMKSTVS